MKKTRFSRTESVFNSLISIGVIVSLLGVVSIILIYGSVRFIPSSRDFIIPIQIVSIWAFLFFFVGPYTFYVGLYFKYIHRKLSTFLKPIGLTLPIIIFLMLARFLIEPNFEDFFPFFSFDLFENITVELLGGLFTAWIFYYGFELSREEEQEKEHKQLLFELKSIREELELIKQQNQQPLIVQSPAPSFITRLIHRFRRS